jgi:hypothetical protein
MKFTGEKLRALLVAQWETVTLVAADGTERRGISAPYAAAEIAGAAVTGYGKNRVVSKIVADAALRRGLFATRRDIAAAMADFPRLPHADKNRQVPGAKEWAPQPTFAHTGRAGKVSTVPFGYLNDRAESRQDGEHNV